MCRYTSSLLVGFFCLSYFLRGAAGDEPDVKTILDKAYAAVGGDQAAKTEAATWKEDVTFFEKEGPRHAAMTYAIQPPNHLRVEVSKDFMLVLDGAKGWTGSPRVPIVMEMSNVILEYLQEQAYRIRVPGIVPLVHDHSYQITLIGAEKVDDRAAYIVKVAHEKFKDIWLSIDKENFHVVKRTLRVTSEESAGKEVDDETLFSDFKKFGVRLVPTATTNYVAGKKIFETKITDFTQAEKLDERLFDQDSHHPKMEFQWPPANKE